MERPDGTGAHLQPGSVGPAGCEYTQVSRPGGGLPVLLLVTVEAQHAAGDGSTIDGRGSAGVVDPQHVGCCLAVVRLVAAGAADGRPTIRQVAQRHDAGGGAEDGI